MRIIRHAIVTGIWLLVLVGLAQIGLAQELSEDTTAKPGTATTSEPLISNVFVETFITQALQDIAVQAGVSILADSSVDGFITLELNNVPLESAIRMVLAPGGYTYVKLDDKTYLVGKADRTSPIFHVLAQTEAIRLNYVTADAVKQLLPDYYNPYVRFDSATNSVLIMAAPQMLQRIKEDILRIDNPPAQVEIQAVVTEVSDEARRQLGLDWDWTWTPTSAGDQEYHSAFNSLQGILSGTIRTPYHALLASLRRMVDSGQASIRANPSLVVTDGQSADIFVGEDRYFKIVTGSEAAPFTRLEPINVGVSLRITPRVAANGEVTLQVEVIVTDVTGQVGSDELPVVSRRQVTTAVRVRDGETLVLGGLVQESEHHVTSKIPILGDLPVLRLLFSTSRDERVKSEVIVFLIPRLTETKS